MESKCLKRRALRSPQSLRWVSRDEMIFNGSPVYATWFRLSLAKKRLTTEMHIVALYRGYVTDPPCSA